MYQHGLADKPITTPDFEDCYFYHVMDIPGVGTTTGQWDLRDTIDYYLGDESFKNKRVLEIGPASGFLTFYMEKQGAEVVGIEIPDDPGWDYVPFQKNVMQTILKERYFLMKQLKASYWFAHQAYQSKAKLYYADVYNLPIDIGYFDVAVLASVLLHCNNPLKMVERCAAHANSLIIVDLYHAELEGKPICQLHPNIDNQSWDTWWFFSTDFFIQFLKILGFSNITVSTHVHSYMGKPSAPLFTIVAHRE